MKYETDNALYILKHHNKNLTREQENAIDEVDEYIKGKYSFDDIKNMLDNGYNLEDLNIYIQAHGENVYSKETLIRVIDSIVCALLETRDKFSLQGIPEAFMSELKYQVNQKKEGWYWWKNLSLESSKSGKKKNC